MVRLPTSPFPPLVWMAAMYHQPVLELEACEHFIKQTWRNRFDIRGANGVQTLSLSVEGMDGLKTPIRDVRLARENWAREHQQSIRSAYNSAAFGEHYMEEVLTLLAPQESLLYDYNLRILRWILQEVGWKGEVVHSSHFQKPEPEGLRARFRRTKWTSLSFPPYEQVFSEKRGFEGNLSVLDLLFNLGPEAEVYLKSISLGRSAFQG